MSSTPPEDHDQTLNVRQAQGVSFETQIVYVVDTSKAIASLTTTPPFTGTLSIDYANQTVGSVVVKITYTKVWDTIGQPHTFAYDHMVATTIQTTTPVGTSQGKLSTSQTRTAINDSSATSSTQTATSSSSATSTPPTRPNGKGLSSGAAAGIGVGAAIGGILLASLVFFFCFRKSRKNEPRYNPEIPLKQSSSYGENKTTGLPQVTAIDTWESSTEKYLPQPVADDSISSEMSKLKSMVNNHVVSYYRASEIDLDAIDEATLAGLMEVSQLSVSQMTSAIVNPQTRTPALRCLIASAIFSRIGLKSKPSSSFLPPEVAGCLESMTGMQDNEHARTALLSKWRTITASMLEQTYGSRTITESDPRSYNINQALEELDSVLMRLRARRDENANRRQNLEEILKLAAGFAFLLFSHPSSWKFEWQTGLSHEPGYAVIFPALLQVTDEKGERLSRPRPFEEVETARLIT